MSDILEVRHDPELDRFRRVVDLTVRLVLIALLVYWCFAIFRPFLVPAVLGVVLAVALDPVYLRTKRILGGRRKSAASLLVVSCLAALLVPTVLLSGSLVEGARKVSARVEAGTLAVPPAPERIAAWPIVGQPIYDTWNLASTNLEALAQRFAPQMKTAGLWVVGVAKQGIGAALLIAVAFVIAGVLWVRRETAVGAALGFGRRVAGDRGEALVRLAARAIGTVAKGVVLVAAIQAVLAALGLAAAGVPGTGLWALLVLIAAVAQLPPILVLLPAILYLVATSDSTVTVVLFTVWSVFVSFCDALLKPLLMGRGTEIPVVVILIGAIGGLILHGLIGLFVGAVVFSIGHTLVSEWVRAARDVEGEGRPEM